ncbi:MAG: class I SAM-dependent methyltransferase [Chloroflexia bacterium]
MDEAAYFASQELKSERKIAWEYGRLVRLARLRLERPADVLDAGCGAGPGLRFFVARGHRVTGVDRSALALQRASRQVPDARLVQADLQAGIPFAPESFDLVVLGDVIEHLPDGLFLLRECYRILRPGGHLLVSTVNLWDLRRFFQGPRWSGRADPTHVCLYNPCGLRRILLRAGFRKVRLRAGAKPILWFPVRWPLGLPWPPLVGNGLIAAGTKPGG